MNLRPISLPTLLVLAVLSLAGGVTLADDTDIYITQHQGGGNGDFQPNVLFIFDTSGSMDDKIETFIPYDSTHDYGGSSDDNIYVWSSDLSNFIATIEPEQNNCKAMTDQISANTSNPIWQGTAAFWKPEVKGSGPGGGETASFADLFTKKRYDNNDGSENWASNWQETGDNGNASNGDIKINNGELQIQGPNNEIERTVNLASYDTAILSFYANMNIDDNGECVKWFIIWCTEYAYPSGQSVTLYVNGNPLLELDHNSGQKTHTIDISTYLTSSVTIRFATSNDFSKKSGQGSKPTLYLDNVRISTSGGSAEDDGDAEPGSWENFCGKYSNCGYNDTRVVECSADAGVHGAGDDSDKWAADGNGPYTDTSAEAFDWNGIQDDYNYVSGNYHEYLRDGTTEWRKKVDVMKEEAKSLVDLFDGINLGLMRFNSHSYQYGTQGGYVVHHFSDISDDAEKTKMKTAIDKLPADANTPLTETMYEAMLYYQGKKPVYGALGKTAAPDAFDGDNYKTPMVNSCQKNHIVLLTDGEPTDDTSSNSDIRALPGVSNCTGNGGCLAGLAGYMANNDQGTVTGVQEIKTYTIGFAIDLPLLSETARKGKGKYFTAGDSKALKDAFSQIIAEILETGGTFTAPAVSVNAYNNLQHRSELYYAMFKPRATTRWPGNIKRYRITSDGEVVDFNGNPAINEETGFFNGTAKSWWSTERDGELVEKGGVVDKLNSIRTVYVYTGADAPEDVGLNEDAHKLHPDNDALDNVLMGLPSGTSNAKRIQIINWARGYDVENVRPASDYHNFVADPLHTRPVVVTYGGTEEAPDDTVFAMTNLGYLSAINATSGEELFSFIPKELLPNLNKYFNDTAEIGKTYGLDGHLTVWREENSSDTDVTIDPNDNDRVHLYFGMRRGGNHYYALDVTDRSNPELMWQIDGGSAGFEKLGQTWSKPVLANVNWACSEDGTGCTNKKVLIFGGGYDKAHDTAVAPTTGDKGSAIFMVDAANGQLLWSAGKGIGHDLKLSAMENSFPADVVTGDLDADGSIDVMFALDIMGHLWRFDINAASTDADDLATGGIVADVSVMATDADADGNIDEPEKLRRFFTSPDVAIFAERGKKPFFSVSFGSGYRAKPKDEVIEDNFYVLFLDDVFSVPKDENGNVAYTAITHADLLNATNTAADRYGNAVHGYYIKMPDSGEKVISDSLTFNGTVYFSSYLPNWSDDACGVDIGGSRLYAMNVLTGEGMFPNGARSTDLEHSGIAPNPVIIFLSDDDDTNDQDEDGEDGGEDGGEEGDGTDDSGAKSALCVGTECFLSTEENPIKKTYWRTN